MRVDLEIISMTANNKKQTTNVTYINPETPNTQLKNFAQNLIGLTKNTFKTATRKEENDVESGGGAKIEPTLTVGSFSYDGYNYTAAITYNGDGQLAANSAGNFCKVIDNTLTVKTSGGSAFSGTLYAFEGETYAAKSIAFTNG